MPFPAPVPEPDLPLLPELFGAEDPSAVSPLSSLDGVLVRDAGLLAFATIAAAGVAFADAEGLGVARAVTDGLGFGVVWSGLDFGVAGLGVAGFGVIGFGGVGLGVAGRGVAGSGVDFGSTISLGGGRRGCGVASSGMIGSGGGGSLGVSRSGSCGDSSAACAGAEPPRASAPPSSQMTGELTFRFHFSLTKNIPTHRTWTAVTIPRLRRKWSTSWRNAKRYQTDANQFSDVVTTPTFAIFAR